MAAMVDITVLAQEVASISSEVDSMKIILSTKIGANDEIMTNVSDKLGSLTGKVDVFLRAAHGERWVDQEGHQ